MSGMWAIREEARELAESASSIEVAKLARLIERLAGATSTATDPRLYDPHWRPGH